MDDINLYRVSRKAEKGEPANMIIVRYGRAARAFDGYGTRVLGTATGYGYDKVNSALQDAIERLYSVKLACNGAAGFSAVQDGANKQGITVEQFRGVYGWKKV